MSLRPTLPGRHPSDREILRLAVPALGALAAEPLYILTDTAVVGHLGTPQLGGLAVAGTLLTTAFSLFNFLSYGTTAAVARAAGAGRSKQSAGNAVQSLWLALAIGVALALAGLLGAPLLVGLMGPSAAVRPNALLYLRIASLGMVPVLLGLVGVGYLRGLQDTVTPLRIALVANAANLVLEVVAIYGLGMGLAASAWATVTAQVGAAVVFCRHIARHARAAEVSWRPDPATLRALVVIGRDLFLRTGSLLAALAVATAVASRLGTVPLGAHQIAFQLWSFLALSLDALAIAAQAMVGRLLGAGDAEAARSASRRMVEWGLLAGVVLGAAVLLLRPVLVPLFSDDSAVVHLTRQVLWVVAVLQPLNAVVFVLDGVLIGAGDLRFLAGAMVAAFAAFLPAAVLAGAVGGTLLWLWGAVTLLMLARLAGVGWRFAGQAWAVTGG
ncbi:MAG TPA: MATE family efflux transporter [Acidimicrobiia bacterium]|nr:MATE family efflux transporter [Acidimicrobiia bacterium]